MTTSTSMSNRQIGANNFNNNLCQRPLPARTISLQRPFGMDTVRPLQRVLRKPCTLYATQQNEIQKTILDDEDVAKMIKEFNFPIPSETLIEKAKQFGLSQEKTGIFDTDMLADDFEFVAPIIGPLKKEQFIKSFSSFKLETFTDARPNYHSLMIDPFQPNRVWMFSAVRGKQTAPLPNGKFNENMKYIGPPEANSVTFNEKGLITKFTIGYVMDRTVGNSGGLGGIFGLLYAFGSPLPFPEARPYKLSWQFQMFNSFSTVFNQIKQVLNGGSKTA